MADNDQNAHKLPLDTNIAKIAAIEHAAMEGRTPGERLGDTIARHAGRLWFVNAHIVWFIGWMVINAGWIRGIPAFDPMPYPFLTFVVSLESIFLSLFILMSQNRANKQADARTHLDLQINLLAEQESTKILEILQKLCEFHGLAVARDPEVHRLKQSTAPEELLGQLKKSLPNED